LIFGRRRAYQRKLAVAEFDGICSAHAMVVRAKPDVVLPEFLPFLMMTDRFMKRAVEISVGSLSPTINWTTLRQEEFDLPPLDQQRRIAVVLCAMDESLHKLRFLREVLERYLDAQIITAMRNHVFQADGKQDLHPLGKLFAERRESGFADLPVLPVTIEGKVVPRSSLDRNVIDRTGTEKYLRVYPGDIAYNTMRMWQGSCGVVDQEGIISPAYTVLVPNSEFVEPIFWNYAFHTSELLDWFRRFSTGVASDRWRLYYGSFSRIKVRVPPIVLQRQLIDAFIRSELAVRETEKQASRLLDVMQSAVNVMSAGEGVLDE
jgi:restriction endonuclease S subunit